MKKSLILNGVSMNLALLGGVCASVKVHAPFEVVVCSRNYHLTSVTQKPMSEGELTIKGVMEVYPSLYKDKSALEGVDLKSLKDSYADFVKCKYEGAVITFTFDYSGYFHNFNFNEELLVAAFSRGSLPFLQKYTWQCELSASANEAVLFNITFDRFRGGNLVMADDDLKSRVIRCVHQDNFPGQVLLEDVAGS